jgi:CHAT domain-containing protein
VPADAPARRVGRLRLLVASARPTDAAPVSAEQETAALRRAFQPLARSGRARVDVLPRATAARLQQRLAETRPDVLHFVGHGDFDTEGGSILLEDGRGGARPLSFAGLRDLLCGRGLRLVSLNACETGRGGRVDWSRGVAAALVAAGVPAVIANQYPVLDTAATSFAGTLFAALARGDGLGDAVHEARVALSGEGRPEQLDWAIPVLFARDPTETLR